MSWSSDPFWFIKEQLGMSQFAFIIHAMCFSANYEHLCIRMK